MGGWKKITTRLIHRNPYYGLRHDRVVRPDGKTGDYYYLDGLASIAVVAVDEKGFFYLVGQTRYPAGNFYSWEVVTGGIRPGRRPLSEAKRELKEEAGLLAAKWRKLGVIFPGIGLSSEPCHVYLARALKKTVNEPEGTEDISIRRADPAAVNDMIKRGRIKCGITLASFSLYRLFLEKEKRS